MRERLKMLSLSKKTAKGKTPYMEHTGNFKRGRLQKSIYLSNTSREMDYKRNGMPGDNEECKSDYMNNLT